MQLRRWVTDLVDLGALGSGAYRLRSEPVRLRVLMDSCLEAFAERASRKGLALESGLRAGVPPLIYADEARLRQVLNVLLDNAVRLTASGSISLTAMLASAPPAGEVKGGTAAGSWVELHLADTGPGIGAVDQDKLLRLFRVLENGDRAAGSGLSIAIAARWCAAMGGCLRIESDGESGSTFVVCLPVGQAADPDPVGNPDLSPPMPA